MPASEQIRLRGEGGGKKGSIEFAYALRKKKKSGGIKDKAYYGQAAALEINFCLLATLLSAPQPAHEATAEASRSRAVTRGGQRPPGGRYRPRRSGKRGSGSGPESTRAAPPPRGGSGGGAASPPLSARKPAAGSGGAARGKRRLPPGLRLPAQGPTKGTAPPARPPPLPRGRAQSGQRAAASRRGAAPRLTALMGLRRAERCPPLSPPGEGRSPPPAPQPPPRCPPGPIVRRAVLTVRGAGAAGSPRCGCCRGSGARPPEVRAIKSSAGRRRRRRRRRRRVKEGGGGLQGAGSPCPASSAGSPPGRARRKEAAAARGPGKRELDAGQRGRASSNPAPSQRGSRGREEAADSPLQRSHAADRRGRPSLRYPRRRERSAAVRVPDGRRGREQRRPLRGAPPA